MEEELMSFDEEKKKRFIEALKRNYRKQYEAVCPIPFITEKLLSVNQVFIDSGIEKKQEFGSWQRLQSYHNIFDGCQTKGFRCFILGDAGYGKSTLCLQLAYDWCNSVKGSLMEDVDLLIILRLRQFGRDTSLYQAIKLMLVPLHSISFEEIEIIMKSSSVKIILDGYDEYLENDTEGTRPVDMIITRKHFSSFDVTITSRYLPKMYPTDSEVLRLTGFDAKARETYVKKAIIDDDNKLTAIKNQIQDNVVLTDLCSVPLIFVMFAHVASQKEHYLRKLTTITGIFRFVISGFYYHQRNKSRDQNVKKIYRFENHHKELDKLAFEGLNKEGRSMKWTQTEMIKKLGKDFYNTYVAIGILVPEETQQTHVQIQQAYKEAKKRQDSENPITEVRFYHTIFCEWYAANFIASNLDLSIPDDPDQPGSSEDLLGEIDPSTYKYVFQFARELRYGTRGETSFKRTADDSLEKPPRSRKRRLEESCTIF